MATIPSNGANLRHVRKTITFDGTAGNGAVGTVNVFSITGRVVVEEMYAFASTGLAGATALIQFDTAAVTPGSTLTATDLSTGTFWDERNVSASDIAGNIVLAMLANQRSPITLRQNLFLTISTAAVTAGVLVIDAWYRPITDNGALAGDDIDTELVAAIWANATRTLSALGFTLGAGDLAADTITAAKIATGAVDADALATDAVAEIVAAVLTTAMTEAYAADGAAPTLAQALFQIMQFLMEPNISGTTMTIKKLDGTTTAFTLTLNSATAPTSLTRAT